MKEFKYTIMDELGIHARPAGHIVKLAGGYQSKITITKDGKTADAGRILALMGLGVTKGTYITVTVDGPDEAECAKELEDFIKTNL
jgi:phosphocarrier protein HPr